MYFYLKEEPMACKLNRSGEFTTPDQFNDLKSGAKGRQDRQNGEQATEISFSFHSVESSAGCPEEGVHRVRES